MKLVNIIFLFLFITLLNATIHAQSKEIDSLKIVLKKTTNDSAKAKLMNTLCFQLSTIDPVQAQDLGNQAIVLAKKSGYKAGLCLAYNNMGILYDQRGIGDSALYFYDKSLVMAREIKNIYLEASALSNIGYINWSQGAYDKALDYTFKALAIFDTGKNYSATAGTIEHIGMIYYDLKDNKNSIKYHHQA
ncbi:MAG TPA: tetratricopeptide repeat protein, partial [Bacteroidia bacterium]